MDRLREAMSQLRRALAHVEDKLEVGDAPIPLPEPEVPLYGGEQEIDSYRALAEEHGLPFCEASELIPELDLEVADRLDREQRNKRRVIPVRCDEQTVIVASDSPGAAASALKRRFRGKTIAEHIVTPTAFRRLQWAIDFGEVLAGRGAIENEGEIVDDLLHHDPRSEVESVALAESILLDGVDARASDIHLEHGPAGVRVRIRVDGDLRVLDHYPLTTSDVERVVRLLKVKGGLDISEHRLAQGGRIKTVIGGQAFFVRIQTQPTVHGENCIMRLLPQDTALQNMQKLGFSSSVETHYRRLLGSPGGLVLVCGPTGSGKTTTLYAALRELACDTRRKVISIEDPVEYVCEGVQQVETCEAAGFGFANAMRAFVREDPDVILLGEVRDPETALEAIRASQTGHLVLSTLHCNDAVDAVQRLLDLEMLPNSVSSELLAIFAQRLAKRICISCREPSTPDPNVLDEVFPLGPPDEFATFRGTGCDACGGTGTLGRIAVVEVLPATRELRRAISSGASLEDLRDVAHENGLVSLRDRALELVSEGLIDFDQLPRFIPIDRLSR